jgi:hypothetical protein
VIYSFVRNEWRFIGKSFNVSEGCNKHSAFKSIRCIGLQNILRIKEELSNFDKTKVAVTTIEAAINKPGYKVKEYKLLNDKK